MGPLHFGVNLWRAGEDDEDGYDVMALAEVECVESDSVQVQLTPVDSSPPVALSLSCAASREMAKQLKRARAEAAE
jgi:hypothetical protein